MIRSKLFLLIPLLILMAAAAVSAEQTAEALSADEDLLISEMREKLDVLLEQSLSAAEKGEWDKALEILDEAEALEVPDPRIASYRRSVLELKALDTAQDSWAAGEPADVVPADPEDEEPIDEGTPKFVIDRGDKDQERNPSAFRDRFRTGVSFKLLAVNPEESSGHNVWGSGDEFLYASIRADALYWLPFLGRSLGFNLRYNGYSWPPGDPTLLFNAFDVGLNIRGFFLEIPTSRLEVGIDFGVSMNSLNTIGAGVARQAALYLGLWVSDPVFYHLFGLDTFENLLFSAGLRIYSSTADELLERIVYRLDGSWLLGHWMMGARLEWWDLGELTDTKNLMSLSVSLGYRF